LLTPNRTLSVMSNSASRCESLLVPISSPFTQTRNALSAAPTCKTTRRPCQSAGTVKRVR
jgi:hypothetical protein